MQGNKFVKRSSGGVSMIPKLAENICFVNHATIKESSGLDFDF